MSIYIRNLYIQMHAITKKYRVHLVKSHTSKKVTSRDYFSVDKFMHHEHVYIPVLYNQVPIVCVLHMHHVCVCIYICMYICMYVCIYIYMYICMYVYTYVNQRIMNYFSNRVVEDIGLPSCLIHAESLNTYLIVTGMISSMTFINYFIMTRAYRHIAHLYSVLCIYQVDMF